MIWQKIDFVGAMKAFLHSFEERRDHRRLALVWRTPNEYSVMDEWLLGQIKDKFDGATLRVCLWLTREEAAHLVSVFREVN